VMFGFNDSQWSFRNCHEEKPTMFLLLCQLLHRET
jgi:hypothetical protein